MTRFVETVNRARGGREMKHLPTIEELRRMVTMNAIGDLFWQERGDRSPQWNGQFAGKRAGTFDKSTGYRQVNFNGKIVYEHRVVLALTNGVWPPDLTDHKDLNKLNNQPHNLREATGEQNAANTAFRRDNTSGHRGVYFRPRTKRWIAQISIGGKRRYLGVFATPEEGSLAYEAAAATYHPEFRRSAT